MLGARYLYFKRNAEMFGVRVIREVCTIGRKIQYINVECVCEKISRKEIDFSVLIVVFLSIQEAATHDITR
jgi:hypothetical protein